MELWSVGEATVSSVSDGIQVDINLTNSQRPDTPPRRSARREDSSWRRSHVWTGQYVTGVNWILQQPRQHQSGILIGFNGRGGRGGILLFFQFRSHYAWFGFYSVFSSQSISSWSHNLYSPPQNKGLSEIRRKRGCRSVSLTSVFWRVAKKKKKKKTHLLLHMLWYLE